MSETPEDTTTALSTTVQSRTGDYFSEATHQSTVGRALDTRKVATTSRVTRFSISPRLPQGFAGNFNGWKKSSVLGALSEVGQWSAARGGGTVYGESDETEPHTELKMITVQGSQFILRHLENGKFLAYGQLAIDRLPSEDMTARRHAWQAAINQRSRRVYNREQNPAHVQPHHCSFCDVSSGDSTGPSWLYDRTQKKTVSVAVECTDGTPPYDVLSYTWGRAASNEWVEVQGVSWKVRTSTGLPIPQILEVLEMFKERYVWVDIFCIPQECPSAKAREVARQAEIFRGATGGVAWLHQTSAVWPLLLGMASWAMLLHGKFKNAEAPIAPPLGTFSAIEELVSDPWFSSTWTLQEAVLRPNMFMIGVKEWSRALFFPHGTLEQAVLGSKHVTVEDFRGYLNILRAAASSTIKMIERPHIRTARQSMKVKDALKLEKLLQDTGLLGLVTPTPASILSAISVRTSVKTHDKYYGIQSVFNLTMQGDYGRSLESVREEFLSYLWTEYAPILALSLNRPVMTSKSTEMLSDMEDTLLWFSYAQLQGGRMSCAPPGFSKVSAQFKSKGFFSFASVESPQAQPWRYEASTPPADHSQVILIRYGLPPIPIEVSRVRAPKDLYEDWKRPPWWYKIPLLKSAHQLSQYWQDRRAKAVYLDRTTRLLYVGQFLNENGHLGLRRNLHVYIEYYLKASGEGHRVGAIVCDLPFGHHKVDGAVIIS